ncbi:MAG: fimbrillin family protein [Prevotella sp.]|nr:fimbrillin family protein [Prevotella sp.]
MRRNIIESCLRCFAVMGVAALTACSSEESANQHAATADGRITFEASVATATIDDAATRAVMEEPITLRGDGQQLWLLPSVESTATDAATRGTMLDHTTQLPSFGVSAYLHKKTAGITLAKPDYFYNLKASKADAESPYQVSQDFYWPASDEYLSFAAYYPYNSGKGLDTDSAKVVLSSSSEQGPQHITFTVNETVRYQTDLLTATAKNQTPSTTGTPNVALAFSHQLAALRFVVGSQFATKGFVKSITLKSVYKKGVFNFDDDETPWTLNDDDRGDFSVSYTADRQLDGTVGQAITGEGDTFLMIPYAFGNQDAATIEVKFWDGYEDHIVSASLAGKKWQAGKTYTYALSSEKLTTLKIKEITFAETPTGAPRTTWQNGEKVGLYVVHGVKQATDPETVVAGRTLRYSNVPVTYNNGVWTIGTVGGEPVIKYPGDTYYLYYPYVEGTPDGYPNECNEVGASADNFFSSVISSHTVETNQSEIADFVSSDLQVAKAVMPEDENSNLAASTIKATMARKVGLAHFQMATAKQIPVDIVYLNNALQSDTPKETVAPTTNFQGNTPYTSSNNCWFYTTNTGTTPTTFRGLATDADTWDAINITISERGATNTSVPTVYSVRNDWTFINSIIYNYTYTDWPYVFTAPLSGTYTMECTGYGTSSSKGGYASGKKTFSAKQQLIVYVGGVLTGNKYFNINGSSDIRTKYIFYTHALNTVSGQYYGPYWEGGGTGTYQFDEKGTNLTSLSGVTAYDNMGDDANGNHHYTINNLVQTSDHLACTANITSTLKGVEFALMKNSANITKSVMSVRNSIIISGGGCGTSNITTGVDNPTSTTATNNGSGKVVITYPRQ